MAEAPIKMPQLGESVTEGTVDRWLKREGDYVKRDEPLVEVVTDKVNAEIPSPFEGKLLRISVAEGSTIPVGVEIAVIEVAGADAPVAPVAATAPVPPTLPSPARGERPASSFPGEGSRLSPAVRRLAAEHDIDPTRIAGTGAGGRVTRDDVLAYLAQRDAVPGPAAPPAPAPAPT